jgi:Ca2+-transporting ATPase
VEPGHNNVLKKPPRRRDENILTAEVIILFALMAGTMLILSLSAFHLLSPQGIDKARTGVFTVLAMTQIFNGMTMRSFHHSLFEIGWLANRYMLLAMAVSTTLLITALYLPLTQRLFHFVSFTALELGVIIVASSSVIWVGEAYKIVWNRRQRLRERSATDKR